jgi:hypothetical protein
MNSNSATFKTSDYYRHKTNHINNDPTMRPVRLPIDRLKLMPWMPEYPVSAVVGGVTQPLVNIGSRHPLAMHVLDSRSR